MIEPQSAQLGASSWILNATFVVPRLSVIADPPPPFPFATLACPFPFLATTASSSLAPTPVFDPDCSAVDSAGGASTATEAFGSSAFGSVVG